MGGLKDMGYKIILLVFLFILYSSITDDSALENTNVIENTNVTETVSTAKSNNVSETISKSNITENYNAEKAAREAKGYYTCTAGNYAGADGESIELLNYYNATDKTYNEVLKFLSIDKTDSRQYTDTYQCGDFAETVHNNAEAAGIKCAWVAVDFVDDNEGHACNAFNTTDRGLIYIDCVNGDTKVIVENTKKYCPSSLFTPGVGYECLGIVKHKSVYW